MEGLITKELNDTVTNWTLKILAQAFHQALGMDHQTSNVVCSLFLTKGFGFFNFFLAFFSSAFFSVRNRFV